MKVITKSLHHGLLDMDLKSFCCVIRNTSRSSVDTENILVLCKQKVLWKRASEGGGGFEKDGRKEGCSKINGCLMAPFRNALLSSLLHSFTSPPSPLLYYCTQLSLINSSFTERVTKWKMSEKSFHENFPFSNKISSLPFSYLVS